MREPKYVKTGMKFKFDDLVEAVVEDVNEIRNGTERICIINPVLGKKLLEGTLTEEEKEYLRDYIEKWRRYYNEQ
jgi:hypothetical protein